MTRRIGFGDKKEDSGQVRRERETRAAAVAARRSEIAARRAAKRAARTTEAAETAKPAVRSGAGAAIWLIALLAVVIIAAGFFLIALPADPVESELLIEDWLEAAEALLAELKPFIIPAAAGLAILLIARRRNTRARTAPGAETIEERAKPRPLSARARRHAERERAKELSEGVEVANGCGRVFIGLFLFLWLSGWTAGIVFAFFGLLYGDGPESWFLGAWISVALIGWGVAASKLWAILTGRDVENVKR